jgi:hypothetical protein
MHPTSAIVAPQAAGLRLLAARRGHGRIGAKGKSAIMLKTEKHCRNYVPDLFPLCNVAGRRL